MKNYMKTVHTLKEVTDLDLTVFGINSHVKGYKLCWHINKILDLELVKNKGAKLIKNISYNEVINKNLKVMDLTAISLAKDTKIPIFITNIFKKNSLINVLNRKGSYSKIS